MHCFISAGEPSGDLHGSNLARALRRLDSTIEVSGLGGPRMRAAGVQLFDPLAEKAAMGLVGVLRFVPGLANLLEQLTSQWQRRRPDVVVLIDYPGFHWHLAARAKAIEIPVVSFVPPQIWAWASYRAKRMRRTFDHVLCALPFEENWFRSRGIPARYIGHPYFDELTNQQLDEAYIDAQRKKGQPIVALLPGSRGHEVRDNLKIFRRAARHIAAKQPNTRFLVAAYRNDHADWLRQQFQNEPFSNEVHVGRTPEIIALADACVAVSGSVGLELLYREVPTVVIYRTSPIYRRIIIPALKNVPFISIVNLLAGRELYPEFLTDRDHATGPAEHVVQWLRNSSVRTVLINDLKNLKTKVAQPGACETAARFLVEFLGNRRIMAA